MLRFKEFIKEEEKPSRLKKIADKVVKATPGIFGGIMGATAGIGVLDPNLDNPATAAALGAAGAGLAVDRLRRLKSKAKKIEEAKSPAWQRKEGKNPEGGLNKKGIASYRKEHPGSKLSLAVTTKPSKLKKGSKKAKRRLSFCRRMKGMKAKLTSAKTARDPNSRINKSLRKWNC